MKHFKTTICTVLLSLASFVALADHSASITATTNYVDRGVSLTDDDGALQATYDYTDENVYAGAFVSNVTDGSEVQLYTGFKTTYTAIDYSVGVTQYIYTDDDFAEDALELNLSAGTNYDGAYVTLMIDFVDDAGKDALGDEIEVRAIAVDYSRTIDALWGLEVRAEVGYTEYVSDASNDYNTHWQVGTSRAFDNILVSFDYYDADNNEYSLDEQAVLSVSYNF